MPFQSVQGNQIYYDEEGSGKTIVFVHGACENSSFWNHQKILADRYRLITLDLPGHGKSKPMTDSVHVRKYADIVMEFVARTCPDQALLVGHSMGGAITLLN
ncbi:MAG TPA: alpha/beta hydrolase, partial [Nitrososphaerales archaeon]|nr:alpha/beta hydrolase [Nitrososphaerales archaeon]